MAATIVNGAPARKTPTTATFPDDEMGRTSATDGTRAAVQKNARHMTPIHPTTVLWRLTLFMARLYTFKMAVRSRPVRDVSRKTPCAVGAPPSMKIERLRRYVVLNRKNLALFS
jgi:hypothetical protein